MKAVLDHIGIAVQDIQKAIAFYGEALGLEVHAPEEVRKRARARARRAGRRVLAGVARGHRRRFGNRDLHCQARARHPSRDAPRGRPPRGPGASERPWRPADQQRAAARRRGLARGVHPSVSGPRRPGGTEAAGRARRQARGPVDGVRRPAADDPLRRPVQARRRGDVQRRALGRSGRSRPRRTNGIESSSPCGRCSSKRRGAG